MKASSTSVNKSWPLREQNLHAHKNNEGKEGERRWRGEARGREEAYQAIHEASSSLLLSLPSLIDETERERPVAHNVSALT